MEEREPLGRGNKETMKEFTKAVYHFFYNYQDADDILVVGFGNQMLVGGKKQQWQIGINTPLC